MTNERHACASPEPASQENERLNPFSWRHECRGRFYYTFQKKQRNASTMWSWKQPWKLSLKWRKVGISIAQQASKGPNIRSSPRKRWMVVYVSAAYTSHRDILLTAKTDGSKRIQARFSPQANFESSTVSLWARRTIFLGRAKRSNCLVIAAGWVKPAILSCHALPRPTTGIGLISKIQLEESNWSPTKLSIHPVQS